MIGDVQVPSEVSVLAPYVAAGVFGSSDVQLAAAVARLVDVDEAVVLAIAVAARGPRLGHVCIDLDDVDHLLVDVPDEAHDLTWPPFGEWAQALAASAAVASPAEANIEPLRPLVFDGRRLYLQRYWTYEVSVAKELAERADVGTNAEDTSPAGAIESYLDVAFGPETEAGSDVQRQAVRVALGQRVSIIAGGPGTGKTHTMARLLAVAQAVADDAGHRLDVALAAPTGKAAARMAESVHQHLSASPEIADVVPPQATTLHRLLGWLPGTQFRHNRDNPLPHDLVIVDETSMVSLQLMARLLSALKPDAQLVLLGDPSQLTSVEAGSVLEDVVGPALFDAIPHAADAPLAGHITVLTAMHRFTEDSTISTLAEAVRVGDTDTTMALLETSRGAVTWLQPGRDDLDELRHEVVDAAAEVVTAAMAGNPLEGIAAATRIKVLAATRQGEFGLYDWNDRIEAAVAERFTGLDRLTPWYIGRPIIVTANDDVNHVVNGDTGLVFDHDGPLVAFRSGEGLRFLSPSRLDRVDTWWAMTIHKSQGSEFAHAVVSLPARPSPILSRQLLYTAVTRARDRLTIVASEVALRAAITHPVARASGLRERLWPVASEGDG
jgi:exodeoxyribonuclease V alpha subunit